MEKSRAVRGRKKYFPLYVDLSEKKVLVAGSGPAALRALGALSAGNVRLFCLTDSDPLPPVLSELCRGGDLTVLQKSYEREDLYDMDYVICCLEDPGTVRDIFVSCRTLGIRICVPGDPAHSDFFLEPPEEDPGQPDFLQESEHRETGPERQTGSRSRTESAPEGSGQKESADRPQGAEKKNSTAPEEPLLPEVTVYTDGAARGNPDGPGGYGVILEFRDREGQLHSREYSQGYRKTTNNRMELMAAIAGLEALTRPCSVDLWSDSQYLVKAFNEHWIDKWIRNDWMRTRTEPVKNADLWKRLLTAAAPHQVSWNWVRGHNGNPRNERCDELATSAADSDNLIEDPAVG